MSYDDTPNEDLLTLYRRMSTPELEHLRWAFSIDRDKSAAAAAFCDRRMALIDHVLREREVVS